MLLGAIGQSIPDIDFIASYWLPTSADLLAHRGFTHSILFAVLATITLALTSRRLFKGDSLPLSRWLLLWGIELSTHLFLDIFNVYGTGLFEPFSHYRVSLNTFFVVDPLFSLWPVTGGILIAGISNQDKQKKIAITALSISLIYMIYSMGNKIVVTRQVAASFKKQHIPANRFFTTPTALNNLLWYVVAQTDSGYYIGYRSLLDKADTITYRYVPQSQGLLATVNEQSEIARLKRFSQGYYAASLWHDTLVFNDLRFGEMTAGLLPGSRFCFYYYLKPKAANVMIIQRGRFAGWNTDIVKAFAARVLGKTDARKYLK